MTRNNEHDAHKSLQESRHDCEPRLPEPERQGCVVAAVIALLVTLAIVLASIAGQWLVEVAK